MFAPARDRYKIFILDEAHMVTPQGFNALLKIVEEPPEHVKVHLRDDRAREGHRPRFAHARTTTRSGSCRPRKLLDYVDEARPQREGRDRAGRAASLSCGPAAARCATPSRCSTSSSRAPTRAPSPTSARSRCSAYTHRLPARRGGRRARESGCRRRLRAPSTGSSRPAKTRAVSSTDLLERLRDLIVVQATPDHGAAVLRGIPQDGP